MPPCERVVGSVPTMKKPDRILALDQGTTSSRAILFDHQGRIRGSAQKEFRQFFPKPGWVEHDAEEIWKSQLAVARSVLRKTKTDPRSVAAIGITNQRETVVVWDKETGNPVAPALVWQDRRTADHCGALKKAGHERMIRRKTGLVIDPYFSATKLSWLLQHQKGLRRRARNGSIAFGTVDSWLTFKLTGGKRHVTDATNASRTLLHNLKSGQWDPDLLELFGVPAPMLPEIRSSSECYGETRLLGGGSIPIAGMAGDQQAALFGQVCTEPGQVKNTYGTGCFLLMPTGTKPVLSKNQLLTTVAWRLGSQNTYALEGSVFIAGAVVQWLRDQLGLVKRSEDIEQLARSVPDNGGVYLVPAFAGLGAPHWDPYARGLIAGLTRGSSAGHLARAALESIAFQSAEVLKSMEQDTRKKIRQVRVDGGACANNLLMQFQSDLMGVPVIRPRITETTAMGAAFLAGLAVGFWENLESLRRIWRADRTFRPAMTPRRRKELTHQWDRALQRSRGWETPTA